MQKENIKDKIKYIPEVVAKMLIRAKATRNNLVVMLTKRLFDFNCSEKRTITPRTKLGRK